MFLVLMDILKTLKNSYLAQRFMENLFTISQLASI